MAQAKTSTTEPKRDTQVRFRVYRAEDEHLRKAAADAGFEDKSAYLRAVLLAKHVVVVREQGIVLIPAATANDEARQAVADLLTEVLEALTAEPSQAAGNTASGPPASAPGIGPTAAESEEAPLEPPSAPPPPTSPGEADGLLGSASHEPPAADTPPGGTAVDAAGVAPGPEEIPPTAEQLAAADEVAGSLHGGAGESMTAEEAADAAAASPDPGLPPELPPPLGPEIQPGETQEVYLRRRTTELKFQGRPVVIARFEAEAEYRRYATAAMAAPADPAAAPLEQPTPGPVACGTCGALKRSPGPCPDCGAPA